MKIFSYFFRPQYIIRKLQRENNSLKLRIAELSDENQSLWDMLDEIKEADKQATVLNTLLKTKPIGDA
jgi:predicted RNase H-like nuclease (RuvC/YqgF family)|tara:strand:- start:280 stop:483 length:204 start_codon:yes stop_codon:yes gene_type:complete